MSPRSRPAYPGKMIAIATFQNLVLDKTPQKEIVGQPGPHIPPSFGNTWGHKITLLNPTIRMTIIQIIAKIPTFIFTMTAVITTSDILRETSVKVLFSRIIAATATTTGLKWLLFFAAAGIIRQILKNGLPKLVENMIARFKATKENSILDDLAKQNAWWKSKEGKSIYERNKKAATQLERVAAHSKSGVSVGETADFAHSHIACMSADELRNRDVVHIWDKEFVDMVEKQPRKGHEIETGRIIFHKLELANKQICWDCSEHVDKIAAALDVLCSDVYRLARSLRSNGNWL